MKRCLSGKRAHNDDLKQSGVEATAIISTDFLTSSPGYHDTRTLIYIWGAVPGAERRNESIPIVIRSLQSISIVQAAAGESHVLFLSEVGEVFSYGSSTYGQLGLGCDVSFSHEPTRVRLDQSVKEVTCGAYHSAALTDHGVVYCWGDGEAIGDGIGIPRHRPHRLDDNILRFRTIAARGSQTMGVSCTGEDLYVWGETFSCEFYHVPCSYHKFVDANRIKKLAIGKHFALALTELGKVFAWGDGTYGELSRLGGEPDWMSSGSVMREACGSRAMVPELLSLVDANGQTLPAIDAISAGARHALLMSRDGRVWAFGDNLAGQCGIPGHQTRILAPKLVKLGEARARANFIACGSRHSACVTQTNQLFLWGHSSHHKLIFTSAPETLSSQDISAGVSIRSGLKDSFCKARLIYSMLHQKVTTVALGNEFTVVVTGDGTLLDSQGMDEGSHHYHESSDLVRGRERPPLLSTDFKQSKPKVVDGSSPSNFTKALQEPHLITAAYLGVGSAARQADLQVNAEVGEQNSIIKATEIVTATAEGMKVTADEGDALNVELTTD